MDGKRIVLTGATGFIGSHLLPALLDAGHAVLAIHRRSRAPARPRHSRLRWANVSEASENVHGFAPAAVVHLATSYGLSGPLSEVIETNVLIPFRILEAAQASACKVFISTDSFFSKPEFKYQHMRPYIDSKLEFLGWAATLAERDGALTLVNARLEHVYGAGDGPQKFITQVLDKLLANESLQLTAGAQLRDFIHVDDVVQAYLAMIDSSRLLTPGVHEIQVGTGRASSVREFVEAARQVLSSTSQLEFGALPYRAGEIMRSVANTAALERLQWTPGTDLFQGIAKSVQLRA